MYQSKISMCKEKTSVGNLRGVEMIHTPLQFRNLRSSEIDCRVQSVNERSEKKTAKLLLYKDARVDMNVLDETVGCEHWQRIHQEIKGIIYCGVGIQQASGEWTWKWDCGTESNAEREKGESSDAFKRACFCWGIGRELYTTPSISIPLTDKDFFNGKFCQSFSVKDIEISSAHEITYLCIVDRLERERFKWGRKRKPLKPFLQEKIFERLYKGEDIWDKVKDYFVFDESSFKEAYKDYVLSKEKS